MFSTWTIFAVNFKYVYIANGVPRNSMTNGWNWLYNLEKLIKENDGLCVSAAAARINFLSIDYSKMFLNFIFCDETESHLVQSKLRN